MGNHRCHFGRKQKHGCTGGRGGEQPNCSVHLIGGFQIVFKIVPSENVCILNGVLFSHNKIRMTLYIYRVTDGSLESHGKQSVRLRMTDVAV